jgi:hypothetical protein
MATVETSNDAAKPRTEPPRFQYRLGVVLAGDPGQLSLSVVGGLELDGWDVADGGVEAAGVPPVHPGQGGQLDVFDGPPRSLHGDQLGLVEPEDRLGPRVVVAVPAGPTEAAAPTSAGRSV